MRVIKQQTNRLIIFALSLIGTILVTRLVIYYIVDPNLMIFGLEMHHFYYGLFLLIGTVLFMLFVGRYHKIYLITSAISIGLIVDQLWFICKQIGGNNPTIYNPSFAPVILIAIIISLIALILSRLSKKNAP